MKELWRAILVSEFIMLVLVVWTFFNTNEGVIIHGLFFGVFYLFEYFIDTHMKVDKPKYKWEPILWLVTFVFMITFYSFEKTKAFTNPWYVRIVICSWFVISLYHSFVTIQFYRKNSIT
jgi:hypothetical protein